MTLLRTICAITTILTIAVAASGCGETNDSSSQEESSSAVQTEASDSGKSAKDILTELSDDKLNASTYFGENVFTKNCKKLYGLSADDLSDGGIIYASEGSADEVSMLKLKDASSAEKYYEARLEMRKTTFDNYKPEESSKITNAQIFKTGDYWVLIISDNADSLKKKIEEAF